MSNISAPNGTKAPKDFPLKFAEDFRLATATFTIVFIVCITVGNILVIAAFTRYTVIRTVTNYFVISLACTDLCVAVFSMPVWVAYLLTGPKWVFGQTMSRVWTMVDILIGSASIVNLMSISFDRILCIKNSLRYAQTMTPKKVGVIIIGGWVYSVAVATAGFLLYTNRIFNLIATIVIFCVPLLFIVTAYAIIFKEALHQIRQIRALTPAQRSSRNTFLKEFKAAKTLAVVVGAFVLCWLPFVVINMIYSLSDPLKGNPVIKPEIILITKWMHYGNSMINPIIYTAMNRDFRRAFKKLLCFRNSRRREEPNTYG